MGWGRGVLEHKSGNISETCKDRRKVTMEGLYELQAISRKYPQMTLKTFSAAGGMWTDSADVTSEGRSFQVRGAITGKARLSTVDSLTVGTTRQLVTAERGDRRPGWSATRLSGPRYCGKSVQDFVCMPGWRLCTELAG